MNGNLIDGARVPVEQWKDMSERAALAFWDVVEEREDDAIYAAWMVRSVMIGFNCLRLSAGESLSPRCAVL